MLLSPQPQDQNSLLHSSPHADGLVRIRTLDPGLVPGDMPKVDSEKTSRKRLIFVGDVHGCKDECKKYPLNHGKSLELTSLQKWCNFLKKSPSTKKAAITLSSSVI